MAPEPSPLPDRTPPSKVRQTRQRTQKLCAICSTPFLVAPSCAAGYHTCSAACTYALRSRQRRGRPWSEKARAADRSRKALW